MSGHGVLDPSDWEAWRSLPWQADLWLRLRPRAGAGHHALLLRGPEGIGKGPLARALAAAWLCSSPDAEGHACGRCDSCGWLLAGNHPDFRRLVSAAQRQDEDSDASAAQTAGGDGEGASKEKPSQQIVVDQVRSLAGFLALSTHRGGVRVLLVDPAEAMNAEAANALLKTLEEPPPGTRFLLISHQPRRLAPTILSRCLPVDVPIPRRDVAETWLRAQGVARPGVALAEAAGRPLHALALAGADGAQAREQFVRALSDAPFDPHALAERAQRETVEQWTEWLQTWCHDLMVCRAGGEPRFHAGQATVLRSLGARADAGRLLDWELRLRRARYESRQPVNPRLFCDELLMDYRDLFRA